ncbi:hypothetical protein H4R99_003740 [Coemansia sp. RSA 1722]|nr:hypothetical protein IWW45_002055 [Coemansia sp. RSA 485]KAJ2599369.1 hypothetical protein H4R99_003740 [Coemansia sp. RSA 1722]KAJ2601457.1 hypothetical protein GGF39_001235 [Coemansia sp. RSA 1721]KAJ2638720.1 hypothetical protein GGF40_001440 [Coemansia sp. RSA 1286]
MSGSRRRVGIVPSEDLSDASSRSGLRHTNQSAISTQLHLLESTKATDRTKGIQQLADILDDDRRRKKSVLAASLDQNTWEQVVTWTSRALLKEAQSFVNKYADEAPSQMSVASDRLSSRIQTQYSVHTRHIWVAAMPFLSAKLAQFLVKFIIETLDTDQCLAGILGLDFAKVLRAWAAHGPHLLSCKSSRAVAVINLCIKSLSRFGNNAMVDTQASTDSSSAMQSTAPGDAEFAAVILAIVSTANPARLVRVADSVFGFCAEYCSHHVRENVCIGSILESAIVVMLAKMDSIASNVDSDNRRRIDVILSCCLQLWPTRSVHLKTTLVQAIRILARIVASVDQGCPQKESESRHMLELVLKNLTSGAWDKLKFMNLPRSLLSIWPVLFSGSEFSRQDDCGLSMRGRDQQPTHLFARLESIVDPLQFAFFDTVAFLVAHLTTNHSKSASNETEVSHRKKRSRTGPTALARMLAAIGADDLPGKAVGAAQVVWFLSNIYAYKIGVSRCVEALQELNAFIDSSVMAQRADLAEWVLGCYLSLSRLQADSQKTGLARTSDDHDVVWQHAVAGIESGLAGSAGLVSDILHRSSHLPSPQMRQLCIQAAAALKACPSRNYGLPDVLNLLILLSQFMHSNGSNSSSSVSVSGSLDKFISKTCSQAITQFCQQAAKHKWPLHLFSTLLIRVLGFTPKSAPIVDHMLVPDSAWSVELRVALALQTLGSFADDLQSCKNVIASHSIGDKNALQVENKSELTATSVLSPSQWAFVAQQLLRCVQQCTENEYAPVVQTSIPYIAHVLWRISQHVQSTQGSMISGGSEFGVFSADQIADEFSERLVAFAADAGQPELLWQTLFFISPWTRGYSRVSSLKAPIDRFLTATFSPSNSATLCCHLSMGRVGFGSARKHGLHDRGESDTQVSVATETSNRLRHLSLDIKDHMDYFAMLEAAMLGTASGLVNRPWFPAIEVLKTLISHEDAVASTICSLLPELIEKLKDEQFLAAVEFIGQLVLLCGSQKHKVDVLLTSIKVRVFSVLKAYNHSAHMPTLFRVLQVVCLLADCSTEADDADEELAGFVAQISNDACDGLVCPFLEMYFIRKIIGPWYLGASPGICHMLSIIDQQPVNFLLHRAQTAYSFAVRMSAEEQKAACGRQMPFILPNGGISVPDLPGTPIDESLILATHDFGLAMLIHSSQSMVPGALGILIMQAEPNSECRPFLRNLCNRLLHSLAELMGFGSIDWMIRACAPDILSIDTGYFDPVSKLAVQIAPQLVPLVAVELVLQQDFAGAIEVLAEAVALSDDCICRLYAHMVVLSVSDPDAYAAAHSQVLQSIASNGANVSLEQMIDDSPHKLILHILMLYLPGTETDDYLLRLLKDINQRGLDTGVSQGFSDFCNDQVTDKQSLAVPKWGRRYSHALLFKAIDAVAMQSKTSKTIGALAGPQIVWIALHLQHCIQSAQADDERQRLMYSLCLLIGSSQMEHLSSQLVQSTMARIIVDSWLCSGARTAFPACFAFALILDSSSGRASDSIVRDFASGLISTLAQLLRTNANAARECAIALFCILNAIVGHYVSAHSSDRVLAGLLMGSSVEALHDWGNVSASLVTMSKVGEDEDRESLALVADQAVALLLGAELSDAYSEACAGFAVACLERLVQLALPLDSTVSSMSMETQNATIGTSVQIDLAMDVVKVLSGIHSKTQKYLQRHGGTGSSSDKRTATLLLRSISLLQVLCQSSINAVPSTTAARAKLVREGDLYWRLGNIMAKSRSQAAITAAIGVVSDLNAAGLLAAESIKHLDAEYQRTLLSVAQMPTMARPVGHQYPPWIQQRKCQRLDSAFLESVCSVSQTSGHALSELVCALASYPECAKLKVAIPLIFVDTHSASCLLPQVLYEIVPRASLEIREEIAAFVLDFAHNWRERAPAMARDLITRALQVRQLDYDLYSDIREFFGQLPLALFEIAHLASKLGMLETTAFLLECDLTCTGAERLTAIGDITSEARELLRIVYHGLGNQSATQILNPVQSVSDVLQRCRDTADWRTLLLYQEAMPATRGHNAFGTHGSDGRADEFEIGDTLVNLGLLNSIRPVSFFQDSAAMANGSSGHGGSSLAASGSQAMFAASWRLAKWDVPSIPLSPNAQPCIGKPRFLVSVAGRVEESLYNMFKLRASGQLAEAWLSVQEHLANSSSVVGALASLSLGGVRDTWAYQAVGALQPLISGYSVDYSDKSSMVSGSGGFVHTSRISSYILSWQCSTMRPEVAEAMHLANITLHEIAVRDAMAMEGNDANQLVGSVFGCYKEAVRAAWSASRLAKNWQNSMNHIFRLRALSQTVGVRDRTLEPELKLWEAETLWDAGSRNLAIEILQSHKAEMERELNKATATLNKTQATWKKTELEARTILLSRIILTVGEWSDKERKERPDVLWEQYFEKSAHLLQGISMPTMWTGRALHTLAEFAARQCEELTAVREDEAANAARKQKSRELAACRQEVASATNTADVQRLKAVLRRLEIQETNDQKELTRLRNSIGGFLRLAIWSFVKCLECTDAFDSSVYSLVSLVVTHARSTELHSVLSPTLMDSVPSHKFLPLIHQLCARLSTEDDAFHKTIVQLVQRMTVDYPYHTMYPLFALRNANRTSSSASASEQALRKATGKVGSLESLHVPESEKMEQRRSEAATQILVGVTVNSPDLKSIVQVIDDLCSSYIELAVSPVPEKFRSGKLDGKLIAFSSRLKISRLIKNLPPNLPVLTAVPSTEAPRDYMCVPFISTFSEGYSLAGGINLPKITRILGSDGQRYKQLVKGRDDMRQDAVIQQLFSVINRFLRPAGDKTLDAGLSLVGGLQIRTYQVVPLTKRSGVLQWVENTMPFGNWFREKEAKYRAGAPGTAQLRSIVHNVHKEKAVTMQEKLEVFDHVCGLAPPIFRFFFYEHFYHAQSWFEHRETYIRSAAVASIAGWVLGIGDRHLQNILIDQKTAEVVHIDLGIAFDLGKLLPIPELVPFRLTREMIDGMGLLGLNGTFRHFCQVALDAMRQNARTVITILNVLKVDPLYIWSLIPLRIHKKTMYVNNYPGSNSVVSGYNEDNDVLYNEEAEAATGAAVEENKEAGRSIMHVGQRLNAPISAEGQVNELIQQATDPNLLSRMFEGWSAWY